jgi:hypothetical protein
VSDVVEADARDSRAVDEAVEASRDRFRVQRPSKFVNHQQAVRWIGIANGSAFCGQDVDQFAKLPTSE